MSTLWLVYEQNQVERNRFFIDQWLTAAREQACTVHLVLYEDLLFGMKDGAAFISHTGGLRLPDAAIMRLNQPLLSHQFERLFIPVFNSAQVAELFNDKRRTHQVMSGLFPVMDTVFLRGDEKTAPFPYPVVVKAVRSNGGRKVFLALDDASFQQALKGCAGDDALAQPLSDTPGQDVRVYVLGREIFATMRRVSHTDFRSNIGQGGEGQPYPLGPKEKQFVNDLMSVYDFGLVGIDFIPHQGQLVFNEIEDAVGTRMLYANGYSHVVSRYLSHILNRLERNK